MVGLVVAMSMSVTMGFPWVSTLKHRVNYCERYDSEGNRIRELTSSLAPSSLHMRSVKYTL